jgi:hypothetical protein
MVTSARSENRRAWHQVQTTAAVNYETFRCRLRLGWDLDTAAHTPAKRRGGVGVREIRIALRRRPMLTLATLAALHPTLDPAHVQRIVRLEVRFGRFARVRLTDVPDDMTGEEAFGYVLTPKAQEHEDELHDQQTPAPWVSSIRAGTASRVETWYRTEPLDYASPFWRGGVA